jgi:hypothetical protein
MPSAIGERGPHEEVAVYRGARAGQCEQRDVLTGLDQRRDRGSTWSSGFSGHLYMS